MNHEAAKDMKRNSHRDTEPQRRFAGESHGPLVALLLRVSVTLWPFPLRVLRVLCGLFVFVIFVTFVFS